MSLSFLSATTYTVGSGPSSVVVKDLDGDGKLDLAVANSTSNNVSVLLNDDNDGFGISSNFSVGTNPVFITSADINGDNKPDLLVANATGNNVSLLLNNGSGSFNTATNFTVGTKPSAIAVGDIDGDNKPDLLVANATDNNVSLLLNNGSGSFSTATNFTVGTKPSAIAVGDIDGDNRLDLVVANATDNNVSLLLNNGSGSFNTATNFTVGTSPNSVVLEDIDGDEKLDLLVGKGNANNVSVLLNNGNGSFGTATNITVETYSAYTAVGDFNKDEKIDLVIANADSNKVSVLLHNSAPTNLILSAISDDDDDDGNGDGDDDGDDDEKVIGIFTATDSDKNDQHTYSLVAGTGDTDNDAFIIEGDSLKLKSSATKSTYNIRVSTTDIGGLSFEKELAVNLNELGITTNNQITTTCELTNITENIFTVKSKIKGGKAKLSIKIAGSNSKVVDELGVFTVDDAEGKIDGIVPGAEGYAELALKRAKIICSAIGNAPDGFNPADLTSLLEFDSGVQLRFYSIRSSTTYAVLSGETSFSEVVFSSSTNVTVESSITEGFSLRWKGGSSGGSDLVVKLKETNEEIPLGTGLQGKHQGELIDLREVTTQVKAEFIINREAAYDNLVGFYKVDDEDGGIDNDDDGIVDLRPGDAGYIKAMISSRVESINLKVNNQGKATFSGIFESGSLFAPFIIANTTIEAILSSNSDDLAVYSSFLGANSSNKNHVRLLGNNCFGFEDRATGSDWDYNDLIVQVKLTVNSVDT